MKFKHVINDDDIVIVYSMEKTELVCKIEELVNEEDLVFDGINYYGYLEDDIVPLNVSDIERFYIFDDKTFCSVGNKKYKIKSRLYQIEEKLPKDFIKINKSDIVNIKHIKRFNCSYSGTILVEMKNGDTDYVSRRMMKNLKERVGL